MLTTRFCWQVAMFPQISHFFLRLRSVQQDMHTGDIVVTLERFGTNYTCCWGRWTAPPFDNYWIITDMECLKICKNQLCHSLCPTLGSRGKWSPSSILKPTALINPHSNLNPYIIQLKIRCCTRVIPTANTTANPRKSAVFQPPTYLHFNIQRHSDEALLCWHTSFHG